MKINFKNLVIIFLLCLLTTGFLVWGINQSQNYSFSSSFLPSKKSFSPTANSSLNFLFLGIAGNGSRGALLADTIFVIHVDPSRKKMVLISIPRDFWVQGESYPRGTKINGLLELENKTRSFNKNCSFNLFQKEAEDILGLKIDYVTIFDLEGIEKLVDDIGGINIWLDKDIIDPNLVDPHYPSRIFQLKAGWNYLDGDLVAKFVRTRYAPSGDFYRIGHQHQILAALKDKVFQLANVWHFATWFNIWQDLNNHYITNLDFESAWKIFQLIKSIPSDQMQYLSLTNRAPDNQLISAMLPMGEKNIYVLIPQAGIEKYEEIHQYIQKKINE